MVTKTILTTPLRGTITSAAFMQQHVEGWGWSKHVLAPHNWVHHRCKGTAAWYADKVGEEWDVLPFTETMYRVNNEPGCGFFFIDKRDFTLKDAPF